MKKRILSLLCIFCLMLTALPVSVFAAPGDYAAPTLSIDASYDSASNKVIAKVILGACSDLGGLDFHMKYDTDKLEVETIVGNEEFGSEDYTTISNNAETTKDIGLSFVKTTGMTVSGTKLVFTATFNVKPGKTGEVKFEFDSYYTNFAHKNGDDTADTPAEGSITVTQVTIHKAPITSVSAKVNAPVKGTALDTTGTVDAGAKYGITNVAWFEGASTSGSSASGTAAAGQVYTAKITLTANSDESFAASLDGTTTGDGYQIKRTSETTLELTKTFDPTADKTLSSIAISGTPTKTNYIHGDRFVINGATVTATYDDTSIADVTSDCTFSYPSGKSYLSKGETKVTVNYGGKTADITGLTVGTKALTITGVAATNKKYDGTAVVTLTDGTLQGVVSGETVNFTLGSGTASQADVGSGLTVTTAITLTGADSGNYTLIQPAGITVNITPADNTVSAFTCADVTFGTVPSPSGATAASGTPTYS